MTQSKHGRENAVADSLLISAYPDLLEAVEACLHALTGEFMTQQEAAQARILAKRLSRAATKKARGEP